MLFVRPTPQLQLWRLGVLAFQQTSGPFEGLQRECPRLCRGIGKALLGEPGELVAGFWLWEVKSIEGAVEVLKRAPFEDEVEVEFRPLFEADDFGEAFRPEVRAQAERQREQLEQRKRGA